MSEPDRGWEVVVHGGAKTIAPAEAEAHRQGCLDAVAEAAAILREGGTAVDAAVAAVRVLEDDPVFNAGCGSVRQADGEVRMDAALMDGNTLDIGAVAGVRMLRHPIDAAQRLLRESPILLIAEPAEVFAAEKGVARIRTADADASQQVVSAGKSRDTVGCIARDQRGDFAAATSTGGLSGMSAGRVGDAAMPGCGFYADNRAGAVAISGDGEAIARTLAAGQIMHALNLSIAAGPASARIAAVTRVGGEAGAIVLDRSGRIGITHNSQDFAVAFATDQHAPAAFTRRDQILDFGK